MERITRIFFLFSLLGLATSSNEAALSRILQHMDKTIDPCEDFQKFSSGKFLDVNDGEDIYTLQDLIIQKHHHNLQKLFDELKDTNFVDESSVEEKVWWLYNTCLTAPKESRLWRHYLELVSPDFDLSWPQFTPQGDEWPKESFQWLVTLARLRRFGFEKFLLPMDLLPKLNDSSQLIITFGSHPLEIIPEISDTENLLISLKFPREKAALLASNILDLETDLQTLAEEDNSSSETMTTEEFEKRTNISIAKYLEIVLDSSIDSNSEVEVLQIKYLEGLKNVIDKYDSEVVATHLMVGFIRYLQSIDGSESNGDPVKCSAAVGVLMKPATEFLYKNRHFKEERLQRNFEEVQRIFKIISDNFMKRLENNRLNLTSVEVQHLKEKLRTMTVRVGSLPEVEDQRGFVTNLYSDLYINHNLNFAEAQLKVLEHLNRKILEQLDRPITRGKEFYIFQNQMKSAIEGSLYETNNVIILPYLNLQEPYFSPEMHDVFKLSFLGYLLAGETLLYFDPYYLPFDSIGNNSTFFGNFEENQGYIDGITCLNRTKTRDMSYRVIDVLALELSYDSFFGKDSKLSKEQPCFFKVALEQLFLLNFAQLFVGYRDRLGDSNDVALHASVSNLKAFAESFNCPSNATLNPPVKCLIW
ncbi:hypothetical protein KR200_004933 [Drosophila serrata]|nr:hypothetical protein KR200_004933 [Drosophila serrata]